MQHISLRKQAMVSIEEITVIKGKNVCTTGYISPKTHNHNLRFQNY